jgi:hypothetical protein
MNSSQIRHKNFHTLFEDFITRHPNQPRRGMLKQFAQHLKLSERYLSHIKCQRKNIGNSVARVIEDALGLPQGWMDREHDAQGAPVDDTEKLFIETALILFRAQPDHARELMLNLLRQQLLTPGAFVQVAKFSASPQ